MSAVDDYWTPYRGIEMLICLPWKGSGGGVVYGFGVWRVKSWVKNVPNTNKYIAVFSIKWGWSPLTYLLLVVIIFEKSIILFYWTPYRGIDTYPTKDTRRPNRRSAIEPLIGGLRQTVPLEELFRLGGYWTPYRGIETFHHLNIYPDIYNDYWTPYRGLRRKQFDSMPMKIVVLYPLLNPL